MRYCPNCKQKVGATKKFSWFWFLLFCITGIGGILYLLWYFVKPSKKCPICGSHTVRG